MFSLIEVLPLMEAWELSSIACYKKKQTIANVTKNIILIIKFGIVF